MSIDAGSSNAALDQSASGLDQLNAACHALATASIQPVASAWYATLQQELAQAQQLANGWVAGSSLNWQQQVIGPVGTCAQAVSASAATVQPLLDQLSHQLSPGQRNKLVSALQALQPPLSNLQTQFEAWASTLKSFEDAMLAAEQRLQDSIAQVQAQETSLHSEIAGINSRISALQQQVATDRAAIAKASSQHRSGVVETIFGVLLAPFSAGASLVLTGIGVASVAEAQAKVSDMQQQIAAYLLQITQAQANMNQEQSTIACLQGLTLSTSSVTGDIDAINQTLDGLRSGWSVYAGELGAMIEHVQDASDASALVVVAAWYASALSAWQQIQGHLAQLTPVQPQQRLLSL